MKIVIMESLGIKENLLKEYVNRITDLGHEVVTYNTKAKDNDELLQRAKNAEILIIANRPLPSEVIEKLDHLKYIDVAFTGFDHVGINTCKEKNINVSNASGYSDVAVAEMVIGLVIDLYRKITVGDHVTRNGGNSVGLMGKEIRNKTVGIIGTGKIGLETARIFKCFGARIIGYNRSVKQEALDLGIEYKSIEEIMQESDIISLNLPSNKETYRFINREKLVLMKEDAIFINCARGPIVDNNALADLLNEGKIAGAGIDVFDIEPPLPQDEALLNAKNCIVTPHVAYLTEEAMERRAEIVFDNLIAYLNGEIKNKIC